MILPIFPTNFELHTLDINLLTFDTLLSDTFDTLLNDTFETLLTLHITHLTLLLTYISRKNIIT